MTRLLKPLLTVEFDCQAASRSRARAWTKRIAKRLPGGRKPGP